MTVEELRLIKAKELQKIATVNGISHSCSYKKEELVQMLAKIDPLIIGVDVAEEKEKVEHGPTINLEGKLHRIERVESGTIVAFKTEDGKYKSAKIVKKSSKDRKLKLETSYGKEYIISYDGVIWVRTGNRWPRGVYNLLKGIEDGQETKESIESQE